MVNSKQSVCEFNKLCICSNHSQLLHEVTCLGVSVRLSEVAPKYYYRIRVIGAPDLVVIRNHDFNDVKSLSSFTLSRSSLSSVESLAFAKAGIAQTLTSLELSYGELRELPSSALRPLHRLQWLSLRANKIEELKAKDLKDITSVRSLLLSDNSLSVVRDHTFEGLPRLELLDLDDNMISRVEGTPFPLSLTTLSLSNCLLQEVPIEAMASLPNLQSVQLRGNLIRHLPHFKFATSTLQVLDLSHNIISSIPDFAFASITESQNQNPNNRHKESDRVLKLRAITANIANISNTTNTSYSPLRIRDLHLDFNFIQSLPRALFGGLSCQRLSLSNNRIASAFISEQAFEGPIEEDLMALDLNYNLIDSYPNAIKSLRNIRQILLRNNRLKNIDENAFVNCSHSLEVLDLSRNLISEIPSIALRVTKSLVRLTLYGNAISKVEDNHLEEWAQSLMSLSLSKNSIRYISRDAFRYAKNLRELRLSGNDLVVVDPHFLTPLNRLQVLDLSDSLKHVIGEEAVQSVAIDSLKWLSMESNRVGSMGRSVALSAFKGLTHLDLRNNEISELAANQSESDSNSNSNLTALILSHNQLAIVGSHAFAHLPHLESIGLHDNRIVSIESKAFESLPKLKTIILSKNYINRIKFTAFNNLSQTSASLSILLDENRLKCFSADIFGSDITASNRFTTFLYLNVSHNEIKQLTACEGESSEASERSAPSEVNQRYMGANKSVSGDQSDQSSEPTVSVRLLDLSYNLIESIPNAFIERMGTSLHSLHVNHNKLKAFPTRVLTTCPQIQILILSNNFIQEFTHFDGQPFVSDLQVLSLKSNRIRSVSQLSVLTAHLNRLRHLDLSDNHIARIDDNAFLGTIISRLHLSNNMLTNSDSDSETECFGVKSSLNYLDLSHNQLKSVPIEAMSCENLIELKATDNAISGLAKRSVTKLNGLRQIDVSNNPIEQIDNKSLLSETKHLNVLRLNNVSLTGLPSLDLPHLTHLELSANRISTLETNWFSLSRNLRHLDLSWNQLQDVPHQIWKYMTRLHTLLLQQNPIDILDTSSFQELKHLRHLDIRGLNLQYIDTRLLHNHR